MSKSREVKLGKAPKWRTLYHVTTWDEKKKIMKEGLVPEEPYTEPGVKAIFLWGDFNMALKYGEEMFGEPPFDEPYTIFEVKLPADGKVEERRVHEPAQERGYTHEYLVSEKIPPKYLKVVHLDVLQTSSFRVDKF
ncbi:MAG: hypothetical protein QW231_04675 [Candidatus Bathyarchaeia archaeon]